MISSNSNKLFIHQIKQKKIDAMASKDHIKILKRGISYWNAWRKENDISPDLSKINMMGKNLSRVNFSNTNLAGARLIDTNLSRANLSRANLSWAILIGTNLVEANLTKAELYNATLVKADLSRAILKRTIFIKSNLNQAKLIDAVAPKAIIVEANLSDANFMGANLSEATLMFSILNNANFHKAKLCGATLGGAICIETDFSNAIINDAKVFGISTWGIKKEGLKQNNLLITKNGEPAITVDNIEVAQFIYLILNNKKIRDVIDTIAKKSVLILGRFTDERKKVLDSIRDKLRQLDYVPIMFDFEKAESKDFTETIKILAGLSRFVIVDITNPKSAPLELQATIPDYKIPFLPIIKKGEKPFSMFIDLQNKYNWVLEVLKYDSEKQLIAGFQKSIIDRALAANKRLNKEKVVSKPRSIDIKKYLK
jgi:uncharacterized protein YjbI with pentapeptide repeats